MLKNILFASSLITIGVLVFLYISKFNLNIIDPLLCAVLVLCCIFYVIHKKFKKKVEFKRLAWIWLITALGILVLLGITKEWFDSLYESFHHYDFLLLVIACFAGFGFFSMLMSKEKDFYRIISGGFKVKDRSSIFKGLSFAINVAFWILLIMFFNFLPWYVHIILFTSVLITTFLSGYFKNKKVKEGFKELFLFFTMFAHFCAESAISGIGVARVFAPIVSTAHFVVEATCDLDSVVGGEHNHGHENKVSYFWVIFSLSFALCSVILGFHEIPKAMMLLGINPHTPFAYVLLYLALFFGGISCFSVNFNCIATKNHNHFDFDFKYSSIKCSWKKLFKGFVSFFGAVLNSTVGVIIASEIFSLPAWLMLTLVILAFITEFAFHYCNQFNFIGVCFGNNSSESSSRLSGDKSHQISDRPKSKDSNSEVVSCDQEGGGQGIRGTN